MNTQDYNCIVDGSSTSCLIQVVDNPTQNLFFGVMLFTAWFVIMIWLFRKQ